MEETEGWLTATISAMEPAMRMSEKVSIKTQPEFLPKPCLRQTKMEANKAKTKKISVATANPPRSLIIFTRVGR